MSTRQFLLLLCVILQRVRSASAGKSHNYYYSDDAADQIIQSEHYPAPYPRDMNVTWTWEVRSGQWGIVFEDFDLDSENVVGSSDYLEIIDGNVKQVRYTDANRPVLMFKTGGPILTIRFITDGKTEPNTRGFRLQILYGKDERELDIKIYDASKQKPEEEKEESSLLIVICTLTLVLLLIVIIILGYCLWRRRKHDHNNESRNAFGIRRGSGISHSRRERPSPNGGSPNNDRQQQRPLQQHQHRVERPVQRSDSQLTWIARAELTTTIQTSGQTTNPNIYTPTDVTAETNTTNQRYGPATNGNITGAAADRGNSNSNTGSAEAQQPQNINTTASTSSREGNPTLPKSVSQVFSSSNSAANINACPTSPAESDRASTGEYIDTVDSLIFDSESQDQISDDVGWQNEKPPSYKDSQLISPPPPYQSKGSAKSAVCYENVVLLNNNDNNSCPGNRCTGGQTNIYINAGGLTHSSNGSLNRINIGASNSTMIASSKENGSLTHSGKDLSQSKLASQNQNEADMRLSRSPRSSKKAPKKLTSSASDVQIVEGYAYLVPSSISEEQEQGERDTPLPSDWKPQRSVTNGASFHLDIVPSAARPSPQDIEKGYVDIPKNIPVDAAKLYANVENDNV